MISFIDYDRVTDTLMYLSDSITLEFVVQLSSKDKYGNRGFLHSEAVYDSSKFDDKNQGRSIRRRLTSFYFVINDRTAFDRSFVIRPQDAQLLKMAFDRDILPWYFSNKTIFREIDGILKIVGNYHEFYYARSEYSYIKIYPAVIAYEDNTYKQGIRIYVSSETTYVDMDIDKFMGLYYLITNTDMCTYASTLVMYAKCPPYDINTWQPRGLASGYNPNDNDDCWNNNYPEYKPSSEERKPNGFFNNLKKKEKGVDK